MRFKTGHLPLLIFLLACFIATPQAQEDTTMTAPTTQLVTGNTRFAFDLYGALRDEEGNLFYAPYSISFALAMAYAGAEGETERQMRETLHFLPQEGLHPAFGALDEALRARDGEDVSVNVANALWGQRGHGFLPSFLDLLSRHYAAGLREVDFATSPQEARAEINRWASEETEGRIDDLLSEGAVNALTRLILTNAVYFKASWLHPFEEELTEEALFRLLDDSEVMVPMMRQTETFRYARLEGLQAVELPYAGEALSMLVLLPDAGTFSDFESALGTDTIGEVRDNLRPMQLRLQMPKFSYRSSFSLSGTLSGLGMPDAFSEGADFSGMDGMRALYIQDVVHKAFVLVDEEGTEAAAATGVVVGVTSVGPEPVELIIDRPFIYLIRDLETETILFMGRVLNPAD